MGVIVITLVHVNSLDAAQYPVHLYAFFTLLISHYLHNPEELICFLYQEMLFVGVFLHKSYVLSMKCFYEIRFQVVLKTFSAQLQIVSGKFDATNFYSDFLRSQNLISYFRN